MASKAVRYAFNGGVICPALAWRADLAKYHTSCRTLHNFLVTPWGSVTRRPGMEAVARLSAWSAGATSYRLIPFEYSQDSRYLLLLSPNQAGTGVVITVYSPAGAVKATITSTPWAPAAIPEIQYVQANDVMWLAHYSAPVQRLERAGDTSWTIKAHPCRRGPWQTANADPRHTITPAPRKWTSADTYGRGDYVYLPGTAVNVTGTITPVYAGTEELPDGTRQAVYDEVVTVANTWTEGDWVVLEGTAAYLGTNPGATFFGVYAGLYRIRSRTSTTITIRARRGTSETPPSGTLSAHRVEAFYFSLQAGNIAKAPKTTPAWWSETPVYGGAVTLQASWDAFDATWVGRRIRCTQPRRVDTVRQDWVGKVDASGATPASVAGNQVTLYTLGTWKGTVELQESTDGGATWVRLGTGDKPGYSEAQVSITREVSVRGALVRGYLVSGTVGPVTDRVAVIVQHDGTDHDLYLAVTGYTSARRVTATVEGWQAVCSEAADWQMGAHDATAGYPRAITLWDERLVLGGSLTRPQTIWTSALGDWEDFEPGDAETSPTTYTLAAASLHTIQWLVAEKTLLVGTSAGEWSVGRTNDPGVSVTNIAVQRHSEHGSGYRQALATSDLVLFAQRNLSRLRAMSYSYETESYQAPDLSILAPHVLTPGIRSLAFTRSPDPVVWAVLDDGTMASFSYDRPNQVQGWATHSTPGGTVLAAVALPGAAADELWCLVGRGSSLYLERMRMAGDTTVARHCDWRHTGTGTTILLTGVAAHDAVSVWSGGLAVAFSSDEQTQVTVSGADPAAELVVGIPFVSTLEPTPLVDPSPEGGGPGHIARVTRVDAYLLESGGVEASTDGGRTWDQVLVPARDFVVGAEPAMYTGQKPIRLNSGYRDECAPRLRSAGPYPVTVCALGVEVRRYD